MMARRLARGCVVALSAVAVLWLMPPIRAAQGGGRAAQAPPAPAPSPRTADGHPDLSARWGGGGGEVVRITSPNGEAQTFPSYLEYEAALLSGKVSPDARFQARSTTTGMATMTSGRMPCSGETREPSSYKPEFWDRFSTGI
jgi:hypothetical protein